MKTIFLFLIIVLNFSQLSSQEKYFEKRYALGKTNEGHDITIRPVTL